MMHVDNKSPYDKGTPDIIGSSVLNFQGGRITYGTGPVVEGDIDILASK